MPLSSRWRCRIARSPSPVFKRASTRSAATNRRIKPRSTASACSGDSTGAAVVAGNAGTRPNQVRRAGQRESSADRLNRSWILSAQTTPQWSRNQSQSRSREFRPSDGRRFDHSASHQPRASDHATVDQTAARASAVQPVRRQPEELQDQARTQRQCRKAVSGGQKVGHTGQNQQPIEQRPGRIKLNLPQPLRPP